MISVLLMKASDTWIRDVESEKMDKLTQESTAASARGGHILSYVLPLLLLQPICSCFPHCSTLTTGLTPRELL